MSRFTSMAILAAVVGSTAIGGLALAADKCTIATSGTSRPAKACAEGGRPEAKKVMKKMVDDAKAKGSKFNCLSCHKDIDNYELTDTAKTNYQKLVALLAKK